MQPALQLALLPGIAIHRVVLAAHGPFPGCRDRLGPAPHATNPTPALLTTPIPISTPNPTLSPPSELHALRPGGQPAGRRDVAHSGGRHHRREEVAPSLQHAAARLPATRGFPLPWLPASTSSAQLWQQLARAPRRPRHSRGPAPLPAPPQTYLPVNQYIRDYFGFKHSFQWATVGLLIGFVCAFRCLALLSLKLFNFQNR